VHPAQDSPLADNLILVVDDDPQIRSILNRYLSRHEFDVREAGSGQEMRAELERIIPAVILLDIGLPDTDGLSLLRELRDSAEVGIIIISGMAEQVDRVVGLELGADDFVAKPIDHRELLARIRSVRRRIHATQTSAAHADSDYQAGREGLLRFEGWELDTLARSLRAPDGTPIDLTTMEFDTLQALATSPGIVLNREQLLQAVARRDWGPFDRAVDALVVKLRRKLGEDPRSPQIIKTVRGVGYVFSAKIDR